MVQPPSKTTSQQCAGMAMKGKRHSLKANSGPASSDSTSNEIFCRLHVNQKPSSTGDRSPNKGPSANFNEEGAENSQPEMIQRFGWRQYLFPLWAAANAWYLPAASAIDSEPSSTLKSPSLPRTNSQQCAGTIKTGRRCKNRVKSEPASPQAYGGVRHEDLRKNKQPANPEDEIRPDLLQPETPQRPHWEKFFTSLPSPPHFNSSPTSVSTDSSASSAPVTPEQITAQGHVRISDSSSTPIEGISHQQTEELLGPTGYNSRKDAKSVHSEDGIHSQPETALRSGEQFPFPTYTPSRPQPGSTLAPINPSTSVPVNPDQTASQPYVGAENPSPTPIEKISYQQTGMTFGSSEHDPHEHRRRTDFDDQMPPDSPQLETPLHPLAKKDLFFSPRTPPTKPGSYVGLVSDGESSTTDAAVPSSDSKRPTVTSTNSSVSSGRSVCYAQRHGQREDVDGLAKDLASVSLHAPSHTSNSTQTPKSSSNTTKHTATSSGGSARPTPTSSKSDASSAPKFSPGITLQRCGGFQSSNDTPCKRRVKSEPPFLRAYREDQSRDLICEPVEGLCNLHEEKVLYGQSEYKSKNGEWVNFENWIPPYLQLATQASLRMYMTTPLSSADRPGYIYAFEIRDRDNMEVVKLKIGRTETVAKRLNEWEKCLNKERYPHRENITVGVYPQPEGGSSLLNGLVKVGHKSPWSHRLERLVHLELADITHTNVHLDESWPHVTCPTTPQIQKSKPPCDVCGTRHREIFKFTQRKGSSRNEWEDIVKPVIAKWGHFVENYACKENFCTK